MAAITAGTITKKGGRSAEIASYSGIKVFLEGCDANNTMKLQRSINNGQSWSDVATYTSNQNGTVVSESTISAQHRLLNVLLQTGKQIGYKLTKES